MCTHRLLKQAYEVHLVEFRVHPVPTTLHIARSCLCYPAVLYQTLLVADEHGLNVLEVLRNCQEQESNPGFSTFKVQWAGHKGSACPEQLSPQTRPLDVLTLLGSGHILPMDSDGGHRRQWAWRNLLQVRIDVC